MLKAWHKSKKKLYVQNTQTLRMDNPYFFSNVFFFYQICTIPFENWLEDFNIDG